MLSSDDTVDVREGYGAWAATYEDTVDDALDLALLDGVGTVRWASAAWVADLGCGTGRTGAWLRTKGAGTGALHGVDLTPQMLTRARGRGEHDRLVEADLADTGFDAAAYDLVIASLVDAHLTSLRPMYREARRLAADGAPFVVAGLHPAFLLAAGVPARFQAPDGTPVAIETHLHLFSAHVTAATAAGFALRELHEAVVDDEWVQRREDWARWRGHPVSYAAIWR